MAFLIFLSLFAAASSQKIMRHETHDADVTLHLGASGEMIDLVDQDAGFDTCIDDYPLGQDASNECVGSAHNEHTILRQELCLEAAREAQVHVDPDKFNIDDTWFTKHPQGCFKIPCGEAKHDSNPFTASAGNCYFYNPVGYQPTAGVDANGTNLLHGVPVCVRKKIINGTEHTGAASSALANGGCRTGYAPIMNENNCTEAADCLGYAVGDDTRPDIIDQALYDDFPLGCFISKADEKVYYNQPIKDWTAAPSKPIGTPLCNVTTVTTATSSAGTGTTGTTATSDSASLSIALAKMSAH